MAISLACYSSLPPEQVTEKLNFLVEHHPGMFTERFIISSVTDLRNPVSYSESVQIEIALEFNMHASSSFSVFVNDKSVADLLSVVEMVIKTTFGIDNVIILLNNEILR